MDVGSNPTRPANKKDMLALIDADIVAYRTAAVNEKADFPLARWQADQLITRIIEDVNASDWKLYLTAGNNNFRYSVYPDYKANRRDVPKPRHLEPLREHLVLDWEATLVDGYEADDALGIASQSPESPECIVCSIDKDLLQLPGRHFNFVRREFNTVSSIDGNRHFYKQLLVGDATDNIKGCPGIGPVNAERILKGRESVGSLYEGTIGAYKEVFGNDAEQQLDICAQLLFVWRQPEDNWQRLLKPKSNIKQEVVVTSGYSQVIPNTYTVFTEEEMKEDGTLCDGSAPVICGPKT